ncbi:unnamed protein product, partial [Adineta steineri]
MLNGEVLVCGGIAPYNDGTLVVPFCEIYSASNRKWRETADMNVERKELTLTLLSNGRNILAVGGSRNELDAYTAEIYYIDMNIWLFVPNIIKTRPSEHTATLLKNGQILIVGGRSSFEPPISSAQLYIPSSNTFVTVGSLKVSRYGHIAILLKDNLSVLIIGGYNFNVPPPPPPEIYMTGSWHDTIGDMIQRRLYCTAVLLHNGNVLVAGGVDSDSNTLSSAEIYTFTTGKFSPIQPMGCARSHFTLTLLPTGLVLAVGGKGPAIAECPRVSELYNSTTNQWMSTRLLNTDRHKHNAVLINNSVLVLGGFVDDDTY